METATVLTPRMKARLAGLIYLLQMGTGWYFGLTGGVVVPGDATATARNLLGSEALLREYFAFNLAATAGYVVVTLILYEMFKPVNRTVSRLAAAFGVAGCAIGMLNSLYAFAPLLLLHDAANALTIGQREALTLFFLQLHNIGAFGVMSVFFGCFCALLGYLIIRSWFFPRIIGAFLVAAGLGYLVNSFAMIVSPPFHASLQPYVLWPVALGEMSLMLWLIIVGVNSAKWRQQAAAVPPG